MANINAVSTAPDPYSTAAYSSKATDRNAVSSTSDPYSTANYSPEATDKNTLSITSYFKLLAAQLANQDMTNPMDSSDLMNQMSQMAMIQSLTAMTTSVRNSTTLSQQSYAASLIGRKVMLSAVDEKTGAAIQKEGTVEAVSLTGGEPSIRLAGDQTEYGLDSIVSVSGAAETSADPLTNILQGDTAADLLLALERAREAAGTAGTGNSAGSAAEKPDGTEKTNGTDDAADDGNIVRKEKDSAEQELSGGDAGQTADTKVTENTADSETTQTGFISGGGDAGQEKAAAVSGGEIRTAAAAAAAGAAADAPGDIAAGTAAQTGTDAQTGTGAQAGTDAQTGSDAQTAETTQD